VSLNLGSIREQPQVRPGDTKLAGIASFSLLVAFAFGHRCAPISARVTGIARGPGVVY